MKTKTSMFYPLSILDFVEIQGVLEQLLRASGGKLISSYRKKDGRRPSFGIFIASGKQADALLAALEGKQ